MNRKMVILNVDDDDAGRFVVSQMLESEGYVVHDARGGEEGLRLAFELHPDLILLDIQMPDIDGYEVCRRVKADPRTASTTVIHMSATFVGVSDKVAGLDGGADGYLMEPVSKPELIATVRAFQRIRNAEAAQRFLADASASLAQALEPDDALRRLASAAVPFLGEWCIVDQLEKSGAVRHVASAHVDADAQRLLSERARRAPDGAAGPLRVLATGRPEAFPENGGVAGEVALGPEHPTIFRELGSRCYLSVPLRARGRTLGALTVGSADPGWRYGPKANDLAEELARRASLLIDAALLHEQARAAVASRDRVLAIVSHDLKNPLSSIQMGAAMIETLAEKSTALAPVRPHAALIKRAAGRMSRLVLDLLDLASLEADSLAIDQQPEDVGPLLDEALLAHAAAAAEREIRLEKLDEAPGAAIVCDRGRLFQVLGNLLGNAIKFTPRKGAVTLGARVGTGSAEIELSVADNGKGIAADDLPHVFERFWRGAGPEAKAAEGTGLGLSIAKALVEAQRGRIEAISGSGAGTTFRLVLPRAV